MAEQATGKTTDDRTPFTSYLIEIDKGKVEADATGYVQDAIRAVELTRKPAKVIVTMTITMADPETFDDTGVVLVDAEAKPVLPRVKRAPAIFFIDGTGGMTRDDPNRDDPRY